MFLAALGRKVSLNIYSLLVTSEIHCALSELGFHFIMFGFMNLDVMKD